jgi:gamma-glutamyl-gamma-aminobutyraldehyde dehydrogenase
LSILALAQIAADCGLPDGVLNVVTGKGSTTGDALARHMDVDVLAFTGSGATGRRLLQASAESNLKRVFLELGGKSPNIVFADTQDLAEAAKVTVNGIFRNSGQICIAGSRLLVEQSIHQEFVSEVARLAGQLRVGDPLDLSNDIGAVHSEDQLQTILSFTESAECRIGGSRILQETGGTYMAPTLIDNVRPSDRVFTQEVFGPVLAVTPFDTEQQAVALANGTEFGLAAAVWTSNLSKAHRMVRSVRSGLVHVNTYGGSDLTVPLGGVKQSGNGHDKSLHALDKYTDLKTAWIKL